MLPSVKKVALVTGAGSGIGQHIALALLRNGYAVALAGRRLDKLQETVAAAGEFGENAIAIAADVSNPTSVNALFATLHAHFDRLDLLFNNAGVFTASKSLEEVDYADWKASVDVNLTGAFLCTQAAFRIMKEQRPNGGRIINNGSIAAHVPRPNSVAYTATKHAMTGLTKATSLDGRKYNIACGQIDIGNTATEMTERMEKGILQASGAIAVEPTMSVENVANAVLYMASLPLNANVQFMTVMATNMPYIGRG